MDVASGSRTHSRLCHHGSLAIRPLPTISQGASPVAVPPFNACLLPAICPGQIFWFRSAAPFPDYLSIAGQFARVTPNRFLVGDRLSASLLIAGILVQEQNRQNGSRDRNESA